MNRAILLFLLLIAPAAVLAQSFSGPATMVYPTTAGHCVKIAAQGGGYLADAGSACGAGSGTVTSFSAGNLSPLFSTSVATATSTPALTFSLTSQSPNVVFAGPASGGSAAPTWRSLVAADLPALASLNLSGAVSKANIGTTGGFFSTTASTLTDTASSGTVALLAANAIGIPTLAASSATTCTSCATFYIAGPPTTGSGITQTASYSLYVSTGNAIFGGNLGVGVNPTVKFQVNGAATVSGGAVNLNASSNFAVNVGTGTTTSAVTLGGGANVVQVGSHLSFTGSAASVSGTGCSAGTPTPNDARGTITTSASTSCTVTFQTAYATVPVCVASTSSGTITVGVTPGTGSVVFATSALTGSIYYHCEQ